MNLKIKRMRELAGFFAQTVRTDGFGPSSSVRRHF